MIFNMKTSFVIFSFVCLATYAEYCHGYGGLHDPLLLLLKTKITQKQYNLRAEMSSVSNKNLPVYVGSQEGRRKVDKIGKLPGQPPNVKFSQYSGHVTVDPKAGRALFYYFAEAENPTEKPLVLWLNGGPGCSSMGAGAMTELGPFRVKPDGKTLWYYQYAWNKVANVLFLESPAGVGFSYSNRSSDYVTGDHQTAADSYTFLLNWLERFPGYKARDFFIAGESYAGHYIPQLADLILQNNKNTKHTVIKLKGIAIGNAAIDDEDLYVGMFDYWWTHALISDETHEGIIKSCNFSAEATDLTKTCIEYANTAEREMGNIDVYGIYAALCLNSSTPSSSSSSGMPSFDPCSNNYVNAYLNANEVQKALHANVAGIIRPWQFCSDPVFDNWTDRSTTVLPVIKKLMRSDIRVWIYSGDTDAVVPVTSTKYSLPKLGATVKTAWRPWYYKGEVGGYAVGYDQNLTFVTIRAAGHFVPSYQPGRALTLFASFLQGKSPPYGN